MTRSLAIAAGVFVLLSHVVGARAGTELAILAVEPVPGTLTASVNTPLVVHFDRPLAPGTISVSTVRAFARWSGAVSGNVSISPDNRTVMLVPDRAFSAGESVMVVLSQEIEGSDGSTLQQGGYSFQFWTRSRAAGLNFTEIDRLSTRVVSALPSQAYGGIGSDLDADGWLDVTIVNGLDTRIYYRKWCASLVDVYREGETSTINWARPGNTVQQGHAGGVAFSSSSQPEGAKVYPIEPGRSAVLRVDAAKWIVKDGWLPGRYEVNVRVDLIRIDDKKWLTLMSDPIELVVGQ